MVARFYDGTRFLLEFLGIFYEDNDHSPIDYAFVVLEYFIVHACRTIEFNSNILTSDTRQFLPGQCRGVACLDGKYPNPCPHTDLHSRLCVLSIRSQAPIADRGGTAVGAIEVDLGDLQVGLDHIHGGVTQ